MERDSMTPRHIGYIVDGNRRWAKERGMSSYQGHLAGYETMKDVVQATFDAGVEYVSVYIFSTENWKRTPDEVRHLMGLVLRLLTKDLSMLSDNNIRLRVLGTDDRVSGTIKKAIARAEEKTAHNTRGTLAMCFNYGGQQEIVDAVKKVVQSGVPADDITADVIAEQLYAPEVPPCDIIVRTSGEQRLSNFMLWRAAYSELIFLDISWPDMTKNTVTGILEEYSKRSRRFGG